MLLVQPKLVCPPIRDKLNELFPASPAKIAPSLSRQRKFDTLPASATEAQLPCRSLSTVLKDDKPEEYRLYRECKYQTAMIRLEAIKQRRDQIQKETDAMFREYNALNDESSKIADSLRALGFGSRRGRLRAPSSNKKNERPLLSYSPRKPEAPPPLAPMKPQPPPPLNGANWHRIPVMRLSSVSETWYSSDDESVGNTDNTPDEEHRRNSRKSEGKLG